MADIITIRGTKITTDNVRSLLDKPSNNFLEDSTIDLKVKMIWGWIKSKITIDNYNTDPLINALYSTSTWRLYGVYVESVSEYMKAQSPRIIEDRVNYFRREAEMFLEVINVRISEDDDPQLSKPLAKIIKSDGITGTDSDVKYQD